MKELDYLLNTLLKEKEEYKDIEIPNNEKDKWLLYRSLRNVRSASNINKEYIEIEDKYLQEEIKKLGIIDEKDIPFDNDIISIFKGDIVTIKCDAIVNAANKYGEGCFAALHYCIDNAIHTYSGIKLRNECHDLLKGKYIETSEVILTSAYNLPSSYIIHTVGPIIDHKFITNKDIEDLKNCYINTLSLCKEKNIRTVAFPCISTGVFSFPNEEASKIAIETVKTYLKDNRSYFDHIIFNTFLDKDYKLYKKYINKVGE